MKMFEIFKKKKAAWNVFNVFEKLDNTRGRDKVYFVRIEKGKRASWTTGPFGEIKKRRGSENQLTIEESVAAYTEDITQAEKFKTKKAAEIVIAENQILKFCQIEKV